MRQWHTHTLQMLTSDSDGPLPYISDYAVSTMTGETYRIVVNRRMTLNSAQFFIEQYRLWRLITNTVSMPLREHLFTIRFARKNQIDETSLKCRIVGAEHFPSDLAHRRWTHSDVN